uniref:Uncharacterized protein n=1 Tax=Pyricularia oryzae (strain P131) TaxID=1143193 RepID=L7IY77_PYRO1
MGSRICSQPPGARLDMADSMTARGERKHVTTARMWIKSKGTEKSHSSSASQIWKEQFGGTYVGWMGERLELRLCVDDLDLICTYTINLKSILVVIVGNVDHIGTSIYV